MYSILVKRTDKECVRCYIPTFKVRITGRAWRRGATLIKRMSQVVGVSTVEIIFDKIVVTKTGNVSWEDLEPRIVKVIFKSTPKKRN